MLRNVVYKRNEKDFATRVVEDDDTGVVTAYVGDATVVTATETLAGGIKNLVIGGHEVRMMRRAGNVGTRMLSGRMGAFDNSTAKTFRAIIEVAASGFDAVRPIFANGNAGGGYTVAGCNVRALADLTDALPSATAVTLPSSGVVPIAPVANRRSYLLGNWVDLASVPRTDGGKGALVCVDAYISTAGSINIMGNGSSDNFVPWVTRQNRKWVMRHNDGDCVTTPANFVSSTNRIQSPIVGVQYSARGRVITVMGVGDSVTDGRGTYIGEGFGVPACEAASEENGVVFEWAGCGWAGVGHSFIRYYLSDAITAGIVPDVVVASNGTPNSFGTPILPSNIDGCRFMLAEIWRTARENQVLPIFWTTIPTNPTVKDYNASDSLRRDYNAVTKTFYDIFLMDFSAALSGEIDGDGQTNMLSGSSADGIHPNDTGNGILSPILVDALRSVF